MGLNDLIFSLLPKNSISYEKTALNRLLETLSSAIEQETVDEVVSNHIGTEIEHRSGIGFRSDKNTVMNKK